VLSSSTMSADDKIRVLVLDDDPAMQSLLLKQLQANGLEVVIARDGLDGLMRLESFAPDVIVSDVSMPGLNGLEFVKAVKGSDATREIPVIFLTSNNDPQSMIQGINLGAKFYLTKPFQVDQLVAKIKHVAKR
jgi:two-component system, chemotaxis family, chemotaxis protein CheY